MANFTPIVFLDTFDLAASLRERMGFFKPVPDQLGVRAIHYRGLKQDTEEEDEQFTGYTVTARWVELANTVKRIKRIGDQFVGGEGIEFGRIFLEMLDPETALPWRVNSAPYFQHFARAHLPLRTNPAARQFVGTESAHLLPGQLTVVNMRGLSSALNLGEDPRVHLVLDFRRKAEAANQH